MRVTAIFLLVLVGIRVFASDDLFGPLVPSAGVFPVSDIGKSDAQLITRDLQPFFDAADRAQYVGLGEPVHGTHIFHMFRAAVIEELISHHRYRTLSFEIPWALTIVLDRYLKDCKGNLKQALADNYWRVWGDSDVTKLFDWICHYNVSHPTDRVFVFGFDNQGGSFDIDTISKYLVASGSPLAADASVQLANCLAKNDSSAEGKTKAISCQQFLAKARTDLNRNFDKYTRAIGSDSLFFANIAIDSLNSFQIQLSNFDLSDLSSMRLSMAVRDRQMADNFERIISRYASSKKSILYAANEHLVKNWDIIESPIAHAATGTYIDRSHPGKYLVVASTGYSILIVTVHVQVTSCMG